MSTIGLDARMIFYTGIGRNVYNLCTRLPALDPANQYLLFIRPEDRTAMPALASNCTIVDTISTIYKLAEQTEHLRILQGAGLDLLHVPHFNIPVRYQGRLVVTIHDLIQAHFPSQQGLKAQVKRLGYRTVISQALRKADRVIAVSRYTRDDIIRTFHTAEDKIQVIYNGVDEAPPIPTVSEDAAAAVLSQYGIAKPFLLYVGLSSPHKNLDRLIEAFSHFRRDHTEFQLVIAGKKDLRYLPSLEEKITRYGLLNKVVLTGYISDAVLQTLYQSARAFVFPSLYEGFGLPPLEALTHGLPVASSNASSLPEVLGDAVIYFNAADTADMVHAMSDVIQQPRKKLPPQPQFSWDAISKQTIEVYRSVLSAATK